MGIQGESDGCKASERTGGPWAMVLRHDRCVIMTCGAVRAGLERGWGGVLVDHAHPSAAAASAPPSP